RHLSASSATEIASYAKKADDALDLATGDVNLGIAAMMSADEQFGTVIKTFDEIGTVVSDAADGVKKHTQHVERLSQLLMGVALALAICASLFVAVLSARGTARNLRGAWEGAGGVADGDLGARWARGAGHGVRDRSQLLSRMS